MREILLFLYTGVDINSALTAAPGATVVCFNYWMERELAHRGIAFRSVADYGTGTDEEERIAWTRSVAREWYRLPQALFFTHKGIPLGEALEPMMESYIARFAYYRSLFERVLGAHSGAADLVVPYTMVVPAATAGPLARFEVQAAVDAARSLIPGRRLTLHTPGRPPPPLERHAHSRSRLKWFISAYNFIVRFAPRKPVRIFASEYWRNIAPFMERMDDIELVLMDRSEIRRMPWREIWKHRVQLAHPRDAMDGTIRKTAAEAAQTFGREWRVARAAIVEKFEPSATPAAQALDYLVEAYAERLVADIEALEKILLRERPQKVLLRASVGGNQHHFFVLARLARRFGIPSIELQHAGAYIDPRSALSRLKTEYLASYGPYESAWYERNGYASRRLISIGSPRFDRCVAQRAQAGVNGRRLLQQAGLDPERPTLVAAVPEEGVGSGADSYVLAEFFRTIAGVRARVPGLQVVFKFRPKHAAQAPRAFVRELIPDAVCMADEDLFSLVCAASIVVCGNSSVIYEALIAEKPLLLHPWRRGDSYHARMYESAAPIVYDGAKLADAVARVLADEAYQRELVARGQTFLKGYCFDGKSAERMAALLRDGMTSSGQF